MSVQYLFNSCGDWIAFRKGEFVFDTDGNWLGWLPWGDLEIVDVSGEYLGTIESDRLYRFKNRPYRGYSGHSDSPDYPGYPGYPDHPGCSLLPSFAEDINIAKLERSKR